MNEQPHAVDAERGVLGALLGDNDLFMHCEGRLNAALFYEKKHVTIYRVMCELRDKGHVDPVVLAQRLADGGELRDAGGKEYLADIASIPAASVNFPAYVNLVRDTALLRTMIRSLSDSINTAFAPGGKTPQELLDEAEARLSAVGEKFQHGGGGERIGNVARLYVDKLFDIVKNKNFDALRGELSGYAGLDSKTNGFHGGDLVIIAGRPGSGKTAFGLNIMRHISAEKQTGVICFSLEMSAKQLIMRLLAHSGVELHKMRSGHGLSAEHLKKLANNASNLENRHIYIEDSGTTNVLEVRACSRRIHREMKMQGVRLGLVVVDYIQLMTAVPGEKGENRSLEIAHISRGLKALAKELDVPVIALSQLNRNLENRPQKRPMLADLRDSGAIEQDADLILFLNHDDSNGAANEAHLVRVELIIGKHRNGPTGVVPLYFDKPYSKFTDIAESGGSYVAATDDIAESGGGHVAATDDMGEAL